jgi:hypothetical protein
MKQSSLLGRFVSYEENGVLRMQSQSIKRNKKSCMTLAEGFSTPPNMDYQGYHSYISNNLPAESPILYGLHPNAEIGFLTATSEVLFRTVFELQPRESGTTGGPATTR